MDEIKNNPVTPEAAPAASTEPVVTPTPVEQQIPVKVEEQKSADVTPAKKEEEIDYASEILKKMEAFKSEQETKPKQDPTAYVGKDVKKENTKENVVPDELTSKLAKLEPELAEVTKKLSEANAYKEQVDSLWNELGSNKVIGNVVNKWLELKAQEKDFENDPNLTKVLDAWSSGKKIDWAAVARGLTSSDSAPASVPSSVSATTPKREESLVDYLKSNSKKDIL